MRGGGHFDELPVRIISQSITRSAARHGAFPVFTLDPHSMPRPRLPWPLAVWLPQEMKIPDPTHSPRVVFYKDGEVVRTIECPDAHVAEAQQILIVRWRFSRTFTSANELINDLESFI